MNTVANVGTNMNDASRIELERLWTAAQNTPCKYAECTGEGHEHILPESDWSHEAVNDSFDGRTVLGSISDRLGTFTGDISFEGTGEMTAAEFRAAADTYEAFPAWLRSMADRMDALTA
ncbi:hypothetical protein [Cryobacterium lyxosi]|uniref:Uncharacterized protein n=1 Tax=Cryobacterium lyxosi TaxID=1259228 RepID=A0A4R8ZHQ5_9MICO|nr:hypothetical protein [Cryobacterium lyxosi]TFD25872.1 hypothetical protein E3T27_08695 [Cryobacterium lyxosi]